MATSGEKKWPPMGRDRWPLTREADDRKGERLSEYWCCLAGLRHLWYGSRIRWG
jgi:hypothetical protein